MKVGEIMTTGVITVGPETPFKDVVERLVRSCVSGLPVVDGEGRMVGLVTEADLMSKEAYGGHRRRAIALLADVLSGRDHHWVRKAGGSTAADVMTTNVTVCGPHDSVQSVARRMLREGVKRLPVVEAAVLVGIVARHDILAMFDRTDDVIAADVRKVVENDLNMPEHHHVRFSVDNGTVTLTGDVQYDWDAEIVADMVRQVMGVIDVDEHLHRRRPNPRSSAEPWIVGGPMPPRPDR